MGKTKKIYDITIVGGGLTGTLAALALASRDFKVALIESGDLETMITAKFDGRPTAIAYASMRMIRKLGLWDKIHTISEPIRDILVSDGHRQTRFRRGGAASTIMHFDSAHLENEKYSENEEATPLGWIVENSGFRSALLKDVKAHKNITIFTKTLCTDAEFTNEHATLTLSNAHTLQSILVLGADGKNSPLRERAKIKTNRWTYPQTGIVATISHEHPHDGFAQEFFLPGGPFAVLPMTDLHEGVKNIHRSSLVWTEKKALAKEITKLENDQFTSELNQRIGPYLGDVQLSGPRWSYPLSFHLSHEFVAPRLALIGDAARTIHPIAGQGFNLGIKDIAALVDVLEDAKAVGLDIGHMTVLQNYQQWRRFDSTLLGLSTDILNRAFSNNAAPVRFIRDLGLGIINAAAPMRKMFMRQAGADVGKLPSLLSGE